MNKFISLLLVLIFASCSSTTTIIVSDKDAKVYVNGEYKGKGTASHSDTKIVGSSSVITLKKKGCETQTHYFTKNEKLDYGALVGGIFLIVPFLWIMKYKPMHIYEMECDA